VRRALPPHYELKTRPEGLNEIAVPSALDALTVSDWASESIQSHRHTIDVCTDPDTMLTDLDLFISRFDDAFVGDVEKILLWFSGKDLLAGMGDWLAAQAIPNPGAFRADLRDWVIANPVRTLELLPEWSSMVEAVRA
jgi:hypothetical protein